MNAERARAIRKLSRRLELRSAEGTAAEKKQIEAALAAARKGGHGCLTPARELGIKV